jgi:hypothetical protein
MRYTDVSSGVPLNVGGPADNARPLFGCRTCHAIWGFGGEDLPAECRATEKQPSRCGTCGSFTIDYVDTNWPEAKKWLQRDRERRTEEADVEWLEDKK